MLQPKIDQYIENILSVPNLENAQAQNLAALLAASKNPLRNIQHKDYIFKFDNFSGFDFKQLVTQQGSYFISSALGVLDSRVGVNSASAYIRDAAKGVNFGSTISAAKPFESLATIQTSEAIYSDPKEFQYYWGERGIIECHLKNDGIARNFWVIVSGYEIFFKELR